MTDFAPPRGMRDFYPEEWRARRALFGAWEEAARLWGFEFFDAPVVETLELLERKAGEEIGEQIYTFKDKSGRDLALRPELTPSLARMIVARQGALQFPLKWAAIAQCFRYERMTRGRKREHYQWNMDIVGTESVLAEAEVIGAAVSALKALKLTAGDVVVRVGSRNLLSALLFHRSIPERLHMSCYLALDKRGKIGDEDMVRLLEQNGLSTDEIERFFEIIPILNDRDLINQNVGNEADAEFAKTDLDALFGYAKEMAFEDWLAVDLGVVRGLGYYTGIVFEAFDRGNKLRAIFGGGRYDRLLSDLGGQKTPCVGLGFGDVVIAELLADLGRTLPSGRIVDVAVGFMYDTSCELALKIAAKLRQSGKSCDLGVRNEKPKKFFGRAEKIGAIEAIYIGEDEAKTGTFEIKLLADRTKRDATLETL